MKSIILTIPLLGLLLISSTISGQVSVLQDKDGETSIHLNEKKQIGINTSDASIAFGLAFSKPKVFWGMDLKFKADEGISKVLEGYKLKPTIEGGISIGKTFKAKKENVIHLAFIGSSVSRSDFNLFNNDSTNSYNTKSFLGYKIYLGYNRIGSINVFSKDNLNSSYLFGISLNYARVNNLKDIKSVVRYNTKVGQIDSTQNILHYDKKNGYLGDYASENVFRLNIDAYCFPQILGDQIGIGGYLRSQLTGQKPRNNLGFGVIIGQKGAPTNIVLGVLYQFNDVFNQLEKENELLKKGGINLIAGYKF